MLAVPISVAVLSWITLATLLACAAFLSFASYARKESATGWIIPEGGVIRTAAIRGGIVDEIFVSEGAVVEEGQPIARIRLSSVLADGDSEQSLLLALERQLEATANAASAEVSRLNQRSQRLQSTLIAFDEEHQLVEAQISLQLDLVELLNAEVERARAISERGHLARGEVAAREAELISARQALMALNVQQARIGRDRDSVVAELASIPLQVEAERANEQSLRAAISERSTSIEAQSSYLITAPRAARVAALAVRAGQALPDRGTVAVLVTDNEQLVAELFIPASAAGFVEVGQEVEVRYEAFDFARYGSGSGTILSISNTVLAPDELLVPGLQVQGSVFRAVVQLDAQSISAYGREFQIQPGQRFSAVIVLDRRSLIQWLFDPIFAVLSYQ